jgi:hypothetical protein
MSKSKSLGVLIPRLGGEAMAFVPGLTACVPPRSLTCLSRSRRPASSGRDGNRLRTRGERSA